MTGIAGAVESTAPVSRLHEHRSYDVADFPVPTGREEEWRFTPLRRLRAIHTDQVLAEGKVTVDTDPAPEVTAEIAARADPRIGRSFIPGDRVSARALASVHEATIVSVPAEAVASRPTIISVRGEDAAGAAFGHLVVDVAPLAEAVLVLDHHGSATYADNVEVILGDGASLSLVSIQDWAPDAVHASHHHATVGRDARLRHAVVTIGGGVVRLAPSVRYAGPGGDAELLGLYFADRGQHLEHRLFVDHTQPRCRSRVEYKGALQGHEAHSVWIGDVLIRAEATGTDTYELNRNLLLTDGARADSVPNLEILTGEVVGAGHASASGRLEDHHLFYLMARGIPMEEARRLVIRGFFGDLVNRIGVPELRERITASIEAELSPASPGEAPRAGGHNPARRPAGPGANGGRA
jgi:Fe-S cluster assembly protein SufD